MSQKSEALPMGNAKGCRYLQKVVQPLLELSPSFARLGMPRLMPRDA